MNFTVYLSDIYIEQYPLITNARVNVAVTDVVDTPPYKGSSQTCDSDWDYCGAKSIEFEPVWGEHRIDKQSSATWKPLTPDQMQEICEEYEDEIVKMLWEFLTDINEEMKYD